MLTAAAAVAVVVALHAFHFISRTNRSHYAIIFKISESASVEREGERSGEHLIMCIPGQARIHTPTHTGTATTNVGLFSYLFVFVFLGNC